VYTGNVRDARGQSTYCAACGQQVIGRDGYAITDWQLDEQGRCNACETRLAGHFDPEPGRWGARRRPLVLAAKES
jgi:pyruvate formate lyase activating enzyme